MDRFYPALIFERCGISVDATVSTRLGYIIGNTTSPTRPEVHNVSLSLPEKVQDTATGKMHRKLVPETCLRTDRHVRRNPPLNLRE